MRCRFYHDLLFGGPHIHHYDVVECEVLAILAHPGEDFPVLDGARMALGQIKPGERYLKVIYVPDPEANGVFVITAFTIRGKMLKRCRSRQRSRGLHHRLRRSSEAPPIHFTQDCPPVTGQTFPLGWDEERVQRVIAHYANQDEDEQIAEVEVALGIAGTPVSGEGGTSRST